MTYTATRHQAPTSFNPSLIDEQSLAQTELNNHLATQSQTVAPEPLTTVEINDHHFEIYAGKWLVAYICYDHSDFITQRWVVMVNGEVVFRHNTQAWCFRFVSWHYKDGTLNPQPSADVPEVPSFSEISFYDQEALVSGDLIASISYDHDNSEDLYWRVIVNNIEIFRDSTPARCHSYIKQQYQSGTLPVQEPFEECSTGNEIMVQIFDECEKYGYCLDDDGIYSNGEKLGEVGLTDGKWWFIRADDTKLQKTFCDSASDAVWWLSVESFLVGANALDEYLQYRPLEQMPSLELKELLDSAA